MLEYVKIASEVGAFGLVVVVLYLFCTGRIISEASVNKLMAAQANHMADLKTAMTDVKDGIGKKLDEAIVVLEQIRENGAMNRKK